VLGKEYRQDYDNHRPHSALEYQKTEEFAQRSLVHLPRRTKPTTKHLKPTNSHRKRKKTGDRPQMPCRAAPASIYSVMSRVPASKVEIHL